MAEAGEGDHGLTRALHQVRDAIGGGGAALAVATGLVVYIWTAHLSDSASKHADLAVKIAEIDRDQREYQAQSARDTLERIRVEKDRDEKNVEQDARQNAILERVEKRLDDDDDEARKEDREREARRDKRRDTSKK